MRTIRPAEEVEVMCMREAPEFVRGTRICARVVSAAGPWRRQGEWWTSVRGVVGRPHPRPLPGQGEGVREEGVGNSLAASSWHANTPLSYARDYYELALADGGVYRMYCDLYSGKWFVDGIYD